MEFCSLISNSFSSKGFGRAPMPQRAICLTNLFDNAGSVRYRKRMLRAAHHHHHHAHGASAAVLAELA